MSSPTTERLVAVLGTWGKPVDRPAQWALGIACALAVVAIAPASFHEALGIPVELPRRVEIRRRVVMVLAFVAAFLSLGYVAFYLRDGPRIIDATSYFLEGRVLSHGHFSWTIPSPSASFRGRFLLYREPNTLSVIFPPGFPLLLAAGFLVGAPLVIGPLLAGALVVATYWLARELAFDRPEAERQWVATLAAALSIVCVALRYHTADTMSHGASALGVTVALAAAFLGARTKLRSPWLLAGLAVGYVVCTRPVSSLAIGGMVLALAFPRGRTKAFLVGVIPGALFLALASRAQTGSWLASAQAAYYAVSDGPPGCFRYGFGHDIGCMVEHKDFVVARLPHGYGAVEALLTTLRRLRAHLLDVANLEPLALLVLFPVLKRAYVEEHPILLPPKSGGGREGGRARTLARARIALAVVLGQILAYVPFYFDGDYPGGGARFFADVLPIEHALLALGVTLLLPRVSAVRRAAGLLALALLGFAVHGAFEHEALAKRDGGRPMYDAEEGRSVGHGLLFFDTDHGFDLAYDPFADPAHAVLAARLRGDDHDRLLVDRLEHPQVHVYRQEGKRSNVGGWTSKGGGTKDLWRFEAEADWPPLTQRGGWAEPVWASNSCATEGRALTLHLAPGSTSAVATIDVPVPRTGKWIVLPRVLRRGGPGHAKLRLIPHRQTPRPSDADLVWEWNDKATGPNTDGDACRELPPLETAHGVELDVAGATWELTATSGDVTLDQTTLKAAR